MVQWLVLQWLVCCSSGWFSAADYITATFNAALIQLLSMLPCSLCSRLGAVWYSNASFAGSAVQCSPDLWAIIWIPDSVQGYGLLAMQAHFSSHHPPECNMLGQSSNCKHIHGLNYLLLVVALCTIALGEGVLRAYLASFGGDQFDDNDSAETQQKSTFCNWFAFGISIGTFTGLILVVWIENNKGWDQGLALSACLTLLGVLVFSSGFPFYHYQKPSGSPLTRMLQVFVAAFRKRELDLAENVEALHPDQVKEDIIGGEVLQQTKSFKFLDKASIFNENANNWSLCTVTQVEDTMIVLRMVPLFLLQSSATCLFPYYRHSVQQESTMDTKFGPIQISPATLLNVSNSKPLLPMIASLFPLRGN